MSANPYSLETYIGTVSKRISSNIINHYISYMKVSGFSINAENIRLFERILWEAYPDGISFQAWYTFDKGKSKDAEIKQALIYAFENIDIHCAYIIENENENEEKTTSCQ